MPNYKKMAPRFVKCSFCYTRMRQGKYKLCELCKLKHDQVTLTSLSVIYNYSFEEIGAGFSYDDHGSWLVKMNDNES